MKKGADALILRGAVTDSIASSLANAGKLLKNTLIVAEDASRLLLKRASFEKLLRFTKGAAVIKPTRLIAVTVNPFSAYGMHYDKNEFREEVTERLKRAGVEAPVLDVKHV